MIALLVTLAAAMGGTVTESTGGVLPDVVSRTVHEASGNSFEAVTDACRTELAGFAR